MFRPIKIYALIIWLLSVLPNQFLIANAALSDSKILAIQKEINKDNVKEATRLLKKIKINSESEQERINLLFGDIYLKINQPSKAIEFYEKSNMTTNEKIESLANLGLAEAHLQKGKLVKAINYVEQSLLIDEDNTRSKIVLATAKNRNGDHEGALQILNDLYFSHKDNAEVNLAIANYHLSFDENKKAIDILEKFFKRSPDNVKVMDQLANSYWLIGENKKAITLKYKVYKHYVHVGNRYLASKTKTWIISVEPDYFTKKNKPRTISPKKSKEYEEEEVNAYDGNKVTNYYEEFDFAANSGGSGFIVGNGKFVITNYHVIQGVKRIAVRNGIGKVSNAQIAGVSEEYDLAILSLEKPFKKKFSINHKNFQDPKPGEDVVSIGYPLVGGGFKLPMITQGVVSKVIQEKGIFLTTAAVNSGNSGGPIFNLNGKLVGVSFAAIDKAKFLKKFGQIPTDLGYAINSNMIKKVFTHKKTVPVRSMKYNKSAIYEMMLPSIVVVATLIDIKEKK